MTRRIIRSPDPRTLVVHTRAEHDAGACTPGCPWCMTTSDDHLPIVVIDDTTQEPRKSDAGQ